MIDFDDPEVAGKEIEYAERIRDERLSIFARQKRGYTSPFFRSTVGEDRSTFDGDFGTQENYNPENHYFEFVALMLPRLAFSNPTVSVTTSRLGPQEQVAIAMKHGINRWIVDSRMERLLGQVAVDFMFNYGACHVSMAENEIMTPDRDEPSPLWPEVNRISQEDFFRDPLALSPEEVRFIGHSYLIDKDDLLELARQENKEDKDAGWDVKTIEGIPPGFGFDDDRLSGDGPEREQLRIKEVWVAGYKDSDHPGADEGFHGTTFYYAFPADTKDNAPISIRKGQPFYGPSSGPYAIGGMYYVSDDAYHLSSLTANEGPIRDLNRHAREMSNSMARYKRLILADNTDPLFQDKIRDAEHDLVIGIDGMDKAKMLNVDVGGISSEWVSYFMLAKDRVDRNSGINEAMRGAVTGAGTATENALADQSSDTRIAWIKHEFTHFVEDILSKVAWYMYHNDDIKFPLGKDAADDLGVQPSLNPQTQKMEMPLIMFEGGDEDRKSGAAFEDLELRIEVLSMEHTSEATLQRRALQVLEILTQVSQVAPMAPFIPWKWVLKTIGDALNIKGLAEGFDEEIYQQMVGMAMAERQLGMEAQLGKQAKVDDEPRQQIQMPFLQGNSSGSMLGGTTGAGGAKQGAA